MSLFAGKKTIVPGAAGGIGEAIGTQLIVEGAQVAGIDRDDAGLKRLEQKYAARFCSATADLQNVEATKAGVHSAVAALGGPAQVLVNAAGVYSLAPAMQVQAEDWYFNQSINLRATFFASQATGDAALSLRRQQGGPAWPDHRHGGGLGENQCPRQRRGAGRHRHQQVA